MVVDNQNLEKTLAKYADELGTTYTNEEEVAIVKYLELVEADEEMKIWQKYAVKSFVVLGLRILNLDAALLFKTVKDMLHLATKKYPEIIGVIDPLGLKPLIERKIFQVVKRPSNDPDGPVVIVMRIGNWHMSDGSIEEMSAVGALYGWHVIKNSPEIQKQGLLIIGDMAGFKLKHARQITLDLVQMAVKFHACMPQEATTSLAKGVVAINSFTLVEETYNLFKGILPKDIKNLVHITKNDTSVITKLIAESNLPKEFGGTIPDEEAYMEGIEESILADQELFELFKHIQDEILKTYGIKKVEKKKKEKKEKKEKKIKSGGADNKAQVVA